MSAPSQRKGKRPPGRDARGGGGARARSGSGAATTSGEERRRDGSADEGPRGTDGRRDAPSAALRRPAHLRELNRWYALRALRDGGPLTRSELAERMRVSKVTASAVASGLLERGWAVELQGAPGGRGRRAAVVDLNPALGRVLALDVDDERLTSRSVDLRGGAPKERAHATPVDLDAFVDLVVACVRSERRKGLPVRGLALSVPATIEDDGRVRFSGKPRYLDEQPLQALLDARLGGVPLTLVNDINAATVAEGVAGAARAWRDFAFLDLRRSGIGMGLVLGGRPHAGRRGRAGEIGLLRTRARFENLENVLEHGGKEAVTELAAVLATAFSLLDLEGVVFHSEMPQGRAWLAELRRELSGALPYAIELVESELGDAAPLEGAVRTALDDAWRALQSEAVGAADTGAASRAAPRAPP